MPNDFSNQDIPTLIHVAQTLAVVASGDPAYGLAKAATDAIANEAGALSDLALQYVQAEATLRGLTEQKAAARTVLIQKLSSAAKGLEANPAVTDAMFRAAALAARPAKGARPQALVAPGGLTADGFSDGTLALKWGRTERTRVAFLVETSADGLDWDYLATTMRTMLKVGGFAPGVPVYARVTAVNSTLSSPPSNVASVYAPAAPARPALKVA